MADALTPWWVATATGIVTALAGVVGKLWANSNANHEREKLQLRAELASARAELAGAHDRIIELQQQATERGDEYRGEHLRDLRRLTGLSRSVEPPPGSPWPPVIIRETPAPVPRPPRKSHRKPL